jgi:hypothetical protein
LFEHRSARERAYHSLQSNLSHILNKDPQPQPPPPLVVEQPRLSLHGVPVEQLAALSYDEQVALYKQGQQENIRDESMLVQLQGRPALVQLQDASVVAHLADEGLQDPDQLIASFMTISPRPVSQLPLPLAKAPEEEPKVDSRPMDIVYESEECVF